MTKTCDRHKTSIEGFTNKELAIAVADLRYDALAEFLGALGLQLDNDSHADRNRGRPKLAEHLDHASSNIIHASIDIRRAWKICEPHMEIKNDVDPAA